MPALYYCLQQSNVVVHQPEPFSQPGTVGSSSGPLQQVTNNYFYTTPGTSFGHLLSSNNNNRHLNGNAEPPSDRRPDPPYTDVHQYISARPPPLPAFADGVADIPLIDLGHSFGPNDTTRQVYSRDYSQMQLRPSPPKTAVGDGRPKRRATPPMDGRKDSVSPPLPVDRDPGPTMPARLQDPVRGCTYRVGDYLGKGGFAWCYELIEEREGNQKLAVKVIAKCRLTKPHHREKVLREMNIHKRLRHTNILQMYSAFEDATNMYIVLELCRLKSLVSILRQRRRLSEPEARHYLHQLLLAVEYLHDDMKVLHRDVKLGNMMLTDDFTVKLGDFGLAVNMHDARRSYVTGALDLENGAEQSICGTPNYIAPEILRRRGHSKLTEAWAVGCCLYAMLFGRPPFEAYDLVETYKLIETGDYNLSRTDCSRDCRKLLQGLLTTRSDQRLTCKAALEHPFIAEPPSFVMLKFEHSYRAPLTDEIVSTQTVQSNQHNSRAREYRRSTSNCAQSSPTQNGNENGRTVTTPTRGRRERELSVPRCSPRAPLAVVDDLVIPASPQPPNRNSNIYLLYQRHQKPRQTPAAVAENEDAVMLTSDSPRSSDSGLGGGGLSSSDRRQSSLRATLTQYADVAGTVGTQYADAQLLAHDSRHGRLWVATPVKEASSSLLYVTKWIDYTNKYGFGCQFSDGCVSVIFLDGSMLTLSNDGQFYEYTPAKGEQPSQRQFWPAAEHPKRESLASKLGIMFMFFEYMDQHLVKGGNETTGCIPKRRFTSLRYWKRHENSMMMQMSDDTCQVNYFDSHAKVVLKSRRCSTADGETTNKVYLSYIDQNRVVHTFRLQRPAEFNENCVMIPPSLCAVLRDTAALLHAETGVAIVPSAPSPHTTNRPVYKAWSTKC